MSSAFGTGDVREHYVRRTTNTFRVGGNRFLKPPHWEGLAYRSDIIRNYGDGYEEAVIVPTVSTPAGCYGGNTINRASSPN